MSVLKPNQDYIANTAGQKLNVINMGYIAPQQIVNGIMGLMNGRPPMAKRLINKLKAFLHNFICSLRGYDYFYGIDRSATNGDMSCKLLMRVYKDGKIVIMEEHYGETTD